MDCLQVCEVLSSAHDGEPVDATLLSEARAHAERCAECRSFAALLVRLDAAPAPRASSDLIARLEARTAPVAAEIRQATSAVAGAPEDEPAPVALSHPRRSWIPRFTAFASAAAVLVLALTVGTVALIRSGPHEAEEVASTESLRATETPLGAETYEGAPADIAGSAQSEMAAPAYITFGEEVWVLSGAAVPAPSALTTAGAITSSLDDGGAGERPVYFAGSDRTVLYARTADDRHLTFERVIRTRGRTEYVLVSGTPIVAFGAWPTLPERFEPPAQPDGSPAFRRFGFDDARLDIYVPPGGRIEDGFALAPGTPTDDPAAGNPNWTWWQRLE